jgi:purine nucleosidase
MTRCMTDTIPLLLDTDIGSDIDDAVALAYLLKQPRCDLVGITTVSGDTQQRASLCSLVCEAAGRRDVPIHAGLAGPVIPGLGTGQRHVPQYEAVKDRPHATTYPSDAVDYLRRTIRSRPGELCLFAIGPLTNVAVLFALDPVIPSMLRSLVLMNGDFFRPDSGAEWNVKCDPAASAIVYHSPLTTYGLDVTLQVKLPADDCRRRFAKAGGPLGIVADLAEVWFRGRPEITFHDPLAAAAIFQPDLCTYRTGRVDVRLDSPVPGFTPFTPDDAGPHRVADTVQAQPFFDHYFATVGA